MKKTNLKSGYVGIDECPRGVLVEIDYSIGKRLPIINRDLLFFLSCSRAVLWNGAEGSGEVFAQFMEMEAADLPAKSIIKLPASVQKQLIFKPIPSAVDAHLTKSHESISQIFMGNGDGSLADIGRLVLMLVDALQKIGAMQQPPNPCEHPSTYGDMDIDALDLEQDVESLASAIFQALTGRRPK